MSNIFEEIKCEYNSFSKELKQELLAGYDYFKTLYSPEILQSLHGEDLLNKLFLGKGNDENLCYYLERDKKSRLYGGIGGGNSSKFGLYYSKDKNCWISGKGKKELSTDEAIIQGTEIRDIIVKTCKYIATMNFNTIEDYKRLEDFKNNNQIIKNAWVRKYLHMVFPEYFPAWYSEQMLDIIIKYYDKEPEESLFAKMGQVVFIAKECGIPLCIFANLKTNRQIAETVKPQNWMQNKENDIHYWIYAPGEKANYWEEFYDEGIMAIGWDSLGDLSRFDNKDDMRKTMQDIYQTSKSCKNDVCATWDFANEIKTGDVIFVKKGRSVILGKGIVSSEYIFDNTRNEYKNIRKINWTHKGEWKHPGEAVLKTLTDITQYKEYVETLNAIFESEDMPIKEDNSNVNYWWLNANPKMWSFNNIAIGEEQSYTLYNDNGNKRRIFQYFIDAKPGDIIIGYESTPIKQIVALAKVSKEHDNKNFYFVKTEQLSTPIDYKDLLEVEELKDMEYMKSAQGSLFKLTDSEYEVLMDIIRDNNPINKQDESVKKYTKEDFLSDVYTSSEDYDELCLLLKNKKNLILQGAPGVGKTFTAKRLAYSIMGEKDNNRIEMVQFHQNYTYEDFVMGYKPNGSDFELRNGIFYQFCTKAANNPDKEYFFIIDEINRGNMSKIFGELLMLIEKDYRGAEHKITLAYNQKPFYVPNNLYIIGMMNTADRSLAMIDYALRRRFSFYEIEPRFASKGFKNYQKSLSNDIFDNLMMKIEELNKDIKQDGSLGSGFCIGHSYFCNQTKCSKNWMKSIIRYEIIPMLQEYWFDDNQKVQTWINKLESVLDD